MTKLIADQKPAKMPPQNGNSKVAASRQTIPSENMGMASISGAKTKSVSRAADVAPSIKIVPPMKLKEMAEVKGIWNDNETITGLWSINQDKNCWIWVNDVNNAANSGWKKLSTASESGIVALNMLACHAKQVGSNVSYRDEDDGMVHEMYVW